MNQNSPPADGGASSILPSSGADLTGLLTSIHLIWLAVFAVLVIAAIVYGSRLKHKRRRAERQVAEHAEAAATAPTAAPTPAAPAAFAAPDDTSSRTPAEATPPAAPPASDEAAANGPVTQLKGLGPKVAARLAELGITTVGQIAALDHDAAARLDAQLGAFAGRLERDRWVEQARFLAAGDRKGFEAVFGRL